MTERKIYRLKISNIKRINPYPPIKPIEPIISQQALRQPLINPIIPKLKGIEIHLRDRLMNLEEKSNKNRSYRRRMDVEDLN